MSNECFSKYQETDEKRTTSRIFQICSYCGKVKNDVEDYGEKYNRQGFCLDCANQVFSADEIEERKAD